MPMPTTTIPCPPEIFDVEGATIERARRVPVWVLDKIAEIRLTGDVNELYDLMATFVPRWHGLIDPVTGDALGNPEDDAKVFARLDVIEQLPWISSTLRMNPKKT